MTLRVDVRVPVSPTREFAWMLTVLHGSITRHGGLGDVRLTAMIGAPTGDSTAAQAMVDFLAPRIGSVVLDPAAFEERSVHATALRRLTEPTDADVVILMDADLIVCGSLADVCAETATEGSMAGVVAHAPPFFTPDDWRRTYAAAGLGPPAFPYRYTGWPYVWPRSMAQRPGMDVAPPYFNYGFVVVPAGLLHALAEHHDAQVVAAADTRPKEPAARLAARLRHGMYRSQVALTLAVERGGVPHRALGMRFNFPNDHRLEALHCAELADVRAIHLHRRSQGFDKRKIYRGIEGFREFTQAGWRAAGATAVARRVIAEMLPEMEALKLPPELGATRWIW